MKRFLLTIMLMIGMFVTVQAQNIQWYKTTAYAHATVVNGRYYWSDWQDSDMDICFNLPEDRIIVYSPTRQIYKITEAGQAESDGKGGQQVTFIAYDQDYDVCHIRLRVEANGNSQIYVDFNNVAWVYNVRRTR